MQPLILSLFFFLFFFAIYIFILMHVCVYWSFDSIKHNRPENSSKSFAKLDYTRINRTSNETSGRKINKIERFEKAKQKIRAENS